MAYRENAPTCDPLVPQQKIIDTCIFTGLVGYFLEIKMLSQLIHQKLSVKWQRQDSGEESEINTQYQNGQTITEQGHW